MTTTPALARGAAALPNVWLGPRASAAGVARAVVSAALHDPDQDVVREAVAIHTPVLVGDGPNGEDDGQHLYCNECGVLPIDGLGFQDGPGHVADAVRAAILGDTSADQPPHGYRGRNA